MRPYVTDHSTTTARLAPGRSRWWIAAALLGLALLLITRCKPSPPNTLGPGGSASFSVAWNAPTTSADGTPLTDLASYRLYYSPDSIGSRTDATVTVVDVGDSTRYTVGGLVPGTYYVAVSAVDLRGNESGLSRQVRVQVVGP